MIRIYELKIYWKNPSSKKDALEIRKKEFGVDYNSQVDLISRTIEALLDNYDILSKGFHTYENIMYYIEEEVKKITKKEVKANGY